jgi:hypothetical protein
MADPGLRLTKMQETGRRLWIGPLDGLLTGFQKNRASSEEQLVIASMQIVEFIFQRRRTGLLCLSNRMNELKDIDNPKITEENEKLWKKGGEVYKLVRSTFQSLRKQIKAHKKAHDGNMDTFKWPELSQEMADDIKDLIGFEDLVLQYTAVDDWYTVDAGNATHTDDKFTKGIIDAYWMGRIQHPAWLAQKDAWDAREDFKLILTQCSGITFEYPDGVEDMDRENEYAAEEADEEDADADVDADPNEGYFGTFNKHVIDKNLANMRMQHAHGVKKIIQTVMDNGTIEEVGGGRVLPKNMKNVLKSFLEARKSLLVYIYVSH